MAWKIGEWQTYDEGQVHQVLKKSINILRDHGMTVSVSLGMEERKLEHGKGLYEAFLGHEKVHGVGDLLEILARGLHLACTKNNVGEIDVTLRLRTPSDSEENRGLFKDMVAAWVDANPLSFTERFFRLPKMAEDLADRYLDNPLEKSLTKMFGFHFKYRIVIKNESDLPDLSDLRKALYRVLR